MAASNCSGPSSVKSGYFSLAIATASFTASTLTPLPLLPVEYESIAILGSKPKALAVVALVKAMSASCCGVGFGVTAQSAKSSTRSFKLIKNAPDTVLTPSLVLMSCKAGRMVSAVVVLAPLTIASALFVCTKSVPK